MKLYIPFLGDKLTLIQPWTFTLVNERRNESLFGPLYEEVGWEPIDREISYWKSIGMDEKPREYSTARTRNMKYEFLRTERATRVYYGNVDPNVYIYRQTFESLVTRKLPDRLFTLPTGITLIVDRIYIRKGLPEFSSVTFRTGEWMEKPLSRKRFFARLSDVNNMEVEL